MDPPLSNDGPCFSVGVWFCLIVCLSLRSDGSSFHFKTNPLGKFATEEEGQAYAKANLKCCPEKHLRRCGAGVRYVKGCPKSPETDVPPPLSGARRCITGRLAYGMVRHGICIIRFRLWSGAPWHLKLYASAMGRLH